LCLPTDCLDWATNDQERTDFNKFLEEVLTGLVTTAFNFDGVFKFASQG
jgi:hypothetical protein